MTDRRKFVKRLGLSGLGAAANFHILGQAVTSRPAGEHRTTDDGTSSGRFVSFLNGVSIELLLRDGEYHGVGKVMAGRTVLRSGLHSLMPDFRTPDGRLVTRLVVKNKQAGPDGVTIRCSVWRKSIPVMEYMLHSVRNRENLYGWVEKKTEDMDTQVTIKLLPVTRPVGDRQLHGFSYEYSYHSVHYPIFKILDKGTWEVGGAAVGNELWTRVGHVPSIVAFNSVSQRYSTENYMYGIANPNIFQFLPLQTELPGFIFQSHREGVLVSWPTRLGHVRTLLEKPAEKDHIFHFHQHCGDLGTDLDTGPVEVLWWPGENASRTDHYNMYEAVRRVVHEELHRQAGIRQEYISTYGLIEQWDEPDFDMYTDVILPQLAALGIKRVFLPNEFENVMNTWGLSNMCCNVDFKISPAVGVEKVRRFCQAAAAAGMRIDMWGNTAISTTTEMFQWRDGKPKGIEFLPKEGSIMEVLQRAKEPFIRNPSNAIEADHYTPRFAVLNFRDPDIMAYWLKSWKDAYDLGINGIFLDSSFNMSSDKFHFIQNADKDKPYPAAEDRHNPNRFFRPDHPFPSSILSQYLAHLQMVKGMQEIGYSYCGEDLGVFGIHRHGPDVDMIMDSLPLWRESVIDFNEALVRRGGKDPFDVFFAGMAYRVAWTVHWDFSRHSLSLGISDDRAAPLFKVFNRANAVMRDREILSDGKVVKYTNGSGQEVYWALSAAHLALESVRKIEDLGSGRSWQAGDLGAEQYHVYMVS